MAEARGAPLREWHGIPAVFDAGGNFVGCNPVHRSSSLVDGQIRYSIDMTMGDVAGPLRARYEANRFVFGIEERGGDRIYMGPDFIGAGQHHGQLVEAHHYSPLWRSDLRTMAHILPDKETQLYSSLLYDGLAISGVFNGIYKLALDYPSDPGTRERIDAFLAAERRDACRSHVLPVRLSGCWRGEIQVYDGDRQPVGTSEVRMDYRPLGPLRAEVALELRGALQLQATFVRQRDGNRHNYEGPDIYGNAISYGRALYSSQHLYAQPRWIRGWEFLMDKDYTLSVVWQWHNGGQLQHTSYGVLRWEPQALGPAALPLG